MVTKEKKWNSKILWLNVNFGNPNFWRRCMSIEKVSTHFAFRRFICLCHLCSFLLFLLLLLVVCDDRWIIQTFDSKDWIQSKEVALLNREGLTEEIVWSFLFPLCCLLLSFSPWWPQSERYEHRSTNIEVKGLKRESVLFWLNKHISSDCEEEESHHCFFSLLIGTREE